ncbi:MAG: dTMP kinase, partial [Elusimicrobia bacterium]|nr:dTMP kinase [Candidatus Obscuribacterium magneticum]
VCDRFYDATVAYQGAARGLNLSRIRLLNDIATAGLKPHLTILLDLPPKQGLKRARTVKGRGDRLENEGLEFQHRVRHGYLRLARKEPARIKIVRVQPCVEDTQDRIRQIISRKVGL